MYHDTLGTHIGNVFLIPKYEIHNLLAYWLDFKVPKFHYFNHREFWSTPAPMPLPSGAIFYMDYVYGVDPAAPNQNNRIYRRHDNDTIEMVNAHLDHPDSNISISVRENNDSEIYKHLQDWKNIVEECSGSTAFNSARQIFSQLTSLDLPSISEEHPDLGE